MTSFPDSHQIKTNSTALPPECTYTQEIRFAVVMYGGVSLAIYMNGITQELFELVKATAPDPENTKNLAKFTDKELTGSGRVYRKLGQLLGSEFSDENKRKELSEITQTTSISTRFVIDILSGTSAGGINAIFLAKALANDQSIEQIKNLWINEGDIDKLINDRQSLKDLPGITLQPQPESLLNSERMYIKLLDAFEQMEKLPSLQSYPHKSNSYISPYVTELDLYVTATNIRGQVVPIQLADQIVTEKNHRHVFHFVFSADEADNSRNDFESKNNPFLAFSARCTSAFPLAFEPMTLKDAESTLSKLGKFNAQHFNEWKQKFLSKYEEGKNCVTILPAEELAFGDGGYLDNKPFSYAIDEILRHRSDLPVKRKLVYIDPSPEQPEFNSQSHSKPNVIENSLAALISLPRYETIREDITRVLEQNRLIGRLLRITNDWKLEDDIQSFNNFHQLEKQTTITQQDKSLDEMIQDKGISYGSYHRLRISAVTDDLALLLTSTFNFNEDSAEFLAIRRLLREWRQQYYCESHKSQQDACKNFENNFLNTFDFEYHVRRFYFLKRKINDIYRLDKSAKDILCKIAPDELGLQEHLDKQELRKELQNIKSIISQGLKDLFNVRYCLKTPFKHHSISNNLVNNQEIKDKIYSFQETAQKISINRGQLAKILDEFQGGDQQSLNETKDNSAAKTLLDRNRDILEKLTIQLADVLQTVFNTVEEKCQRKFAEGKQSKSAAKIVACKAIKYYFDNYLDYDIITFPILYGSGIDEADEVDVIRISPEDATALIDQKKETRRKLAGNSLYAFGGFLNQEWRKNDLLWGRLDAAERLISALLPGDDYQENRQQLIKEAHIAILEEELIVGEHHQLLNLLSKILVNIPPTQQDKRHIRDFAIKTLGESTFDSRLKDIFQGCLTKEELLNYFQNKNSGYEVDRRLDSALALRYTARSTQVFGKLLEGLSNQKVINAKGISIWVIRVGRILWGLAEIAVPKTFWNIVFQYWLQLLYLAEILVIIGGFVFQAAFVSNFGVQALLITLAVQFTFWMLSLIIQKPRESRPILIFLAIVLWSALGLLGAHSVWQALSKYMFSPPGNATQILQNILWQFHK
ncbi:patatin-like protein [Nostoc sp. FACHB-110]|uniref:patatin-like protein n=1 Tax=Nostoc sp. FACHB-110 TaxID=2692834 RepID=UPI001682B776|nr:patatin-like protein [Nostoc sp. FACHB-110]MBD2440545.1 patatin-like protein [Nostoc sp. FACHB-110]